MRISLHAFEQGALQSVQSTPRAPRHSALSVAPGALDLQDLAVSPHLPLTSWIAFGKSLNDSEPRLSLLG